MRRHMKKGDVVMFANEHSRYAKWFYGRLAVVVNFTEVGMDGLSHCRVRWLTPVEYFGKHTSISDFGADNFDMCNEDRL